MDTLEQLSAKVFEGSIQDAQVLTQQALDEGVTPHKVLEVINGSMDRVGIEWQQDNLWIPEVLMAAKAMQASMAVLRPLLTVGETFMRGTVVIGTVKGDMHDIGKSLVAMMLEGGGFEVIDLGVDVAPARFVEAVYKHHADIVGLSSLLTTTLPFMRDVILALEEAGLREKVRVLIGGAPITQVFSDSIGADGYAPDAAFAVAKARQLMEEAR